ncbi:MAG: flagellar motor protein MotD [Pseudomonadales bacterium]|nr:flagellar motor protein MotD [Pseudomonadales bacterium]MCK5792803.1 flagellar motor protein MotD [Ketobacter sp.]MEC8812976.1 flagellar motor protein MotD [Pseudomonadota bacterium]HAG95573.1 flagellar motor protein MotD [Gammaproteobacteria bacterium]MAQ27640.1 flagellar motor protein MotD [Pseudomonadales bacterium]|tara:strand:- start:31278 stop:32282 length:1005 start_codon:yes stop_codon:yes gene_type:complete
MRRRQVEEHENHERWVISYADFITLLFAFFVVMYSISSVNEGKYKVLSDSLVSVFNAQPKTFDPLTVGDKDVRKSNDQLIKLPVPGDYPSKDDYKFSVEGLFDDVENRAARQGEMRDNEVDHLSKITEQLATKLQQQIDSNEVEIRGNDEWIEVNIKASVLYPSGSATLSDPAKSVLSTVSDILRDKPNPIHVEGYTDNVPIETRQFPSNWELSAARAASVVRYFEQRGINPAQLAAVGYGEHHPVADNDNEEGRSRNRRIALVISKSETAAESKVSAETAPDYKMGTGSNAPLDRRQRDEAEVPLRIIRLQDGGLLFSADAEQDSQQDTQQDK